MPQLFQPSPSSLSVVHGASCPSKIMQYRYLAKLMARKRISFVICYIGFKTRISCKKHMKRGAHLLAPQPEDVKGGCEGTHVVDQAQNRERWCTPVIYVTKLSSLWECLTST